MSGARVAFSGPGLKVMLCVAAVAVGASLMLNRLPASLAFLQQVPGVKWLKEVESRFGLVESLAGLMLAVLLGLMVAGSLGVQVSGGPLAQTQLLDVFLPGA